MNEDFLVNNLIFVLVVIIILVGSVFSAKKTRRALSKLTSYLPGAPSRFPFAPSYKGIYQGLNFTIMLTRGGENSPSYLKISLIKKSTFKLEVIKESLLMKYEKISPTRRKIKVFDEMFDEEFLVLSNKPDRAISYFSNSEIKNAAKELFDLGFSSLIINEQGLKIQKANYNLNIDIEPQRMISVIQKLSILSRGCN